MLQETTPTTQIDARIHEILSDDASAGLRLLLRWQNEFVEALINSHLVDHLIREGDQRLNPESLVRISGSLALADNKIESGTLDRPLLMHVHSLRVLSSARPGIPLQRGNNVAVDPDAKHSSPGASALSNCIDNRLLHTRQAAHGAVFRILSSVHELIVEFLSARDFCYIPTPTLINYEFPGDEHEQFQVPYFGDLSAWLSQTSEVHLGMALAADLERVYDLHPVFRREEQLTSRHLTEFTMLELVFNIKDSWRETIELAEQIITFLVHSLNDRVNYKRLTETAKLLHAKAGSLRLGLDDQGRMLKVKFGKAKQILREALGLDSDPEQDLTAAEEAALGNYFAEENPHSDRPTDVFFITHFPRHLRPFNVFPSSDDNRTTHSFDIIMRGQEICTGCQLLHSHQELLSAMAARKSPIDPDSSGWRPFVHAHEIGMPPWGGFGLGLSRFLQGFLGSTDIRENVLFPRDSSRLTP